MKIFRRAISLPVLFGAVLLPVGITAFVAVSLVGRQPNGSVLLPNGQVITPVGVQIEVNDRPLGIAVSPDGSQAAVATASNFAPRALHIIDLATQTVAQTLSIGNSFAGVAYAPDGNTLYVGGGADNDVKIFTRTASGPWTQAPRIAIASSAPSGLSLSPSGDKVYVALNRAHALGIVDTNTRTVARIATGAFPYATAATKDGLKVYVSNWGGRLPQGSDATDGSNPVVVDPATGIANNGTLSVYDTSTQAIAKTIEVGLHPSAMAFSPDGSRLYVANANSDSISVINTAGDTVERTIDVRLNESLGSAPNAVAVSDDGRTLYVANAGNNAVAVVDTSDRHAIRGFIPVGWFPTALALTKDDRLLVGNGYGFGSIAPAAGSTGRSYADRKGYVSILDVPDRRDLARFSEQVRENNQSLGGDHAAGSDEHGRGRDAARRDDDDDLGRGDDRDGGHGAHPIPPHAGQRSPIEHVIYIIKENRTYDQVFGDLPQGNGDAALAIFGRTVTPNIHALAERFVLLDNYYTAGDQSALGHQWCDEAYSNDYVHKYGNARNDFAGTNPMAFAPTGFLWDNAIRHGRSARIFGEFTNRTVKTPANATWLDFYTAWKNGTAGPGLVGNTSVKSAQPITSPIFPGYDMGIPEQVRADLFLREFRMFEQNKNLPNLIVMLLPIDHTNGTAPGFPTPRAMVADNDRALGRIVDAVSHSSYWPKTAIFVTEDDSQNGVDHVDGHRSEALVISPYSRRGTVDSTLYSTVNVVETIEQILGLPPMNQFDAAAITMRKTFARKPNLAPFDALPNEIPLDEMNPSIASLGGLQRALALASLTMDFSQPDSAPEDVLNRAIWHSIKGYNVPYPFVHEPVCIPALRKAGAGRLIN